MDEQIIFTEEALKKVADLILDENNKDLKLRIFVQGGGCSGFQYGFVFEEIKSEDDFVFNKSVSDYDFEITFLIDNMSFQYLQGATIDYKDDLNGSQFIINNPNAQTTCGCGSSFSI